MFKVDLKKAEELETKLPKFVESSKEQENSRKTSTAALLTMLNPYTMWIKTKLLKRQKYQSTLPVS